MIDWLNCHEKRRQILNDESVLGLSKGDKATLIIIPPILGAVLGWFAPIIAEWLIRLPFIPFKEALEWMLTWDGYWVPIIAMGIGLIAGIIFTSYAFLETLKITISDEEVKLEVKGQVATLNKQDISAIFMEGKHLTILGADGVELYREESEPKKDVVAEAFAHHNYPWVDKDPFENQYLRWVENYPDFPSHVNTLLSAREKAFKNDEAAEAEVLRRDLAKLGVVIRDEDKRQYVRIVSGSDT